MEPGLRPWYTNPAGDTFELEPYRDGMGWQHVGTPKIVQLEVAQNWKASCRDRADDWLLTKKDRHGRASVVVSVVGDQFGVDSNAIQMFSDRQVLFTTRDEAIRAACFAVIQEKSNG